jgi:hypothetical protein
VTGGLFPLKDPPVHANDELNLDPLCSAMASVLGGDKVRR